MGQIMRRLPKAAKSFVSKSSKIPKKEVEKANWKNVEWHIE